MKFYIIDAFTEKVFGGNPAGVVIIPTEGDFPSEQLMQKTAAELRYSETAFIKQKAENEFQIRYFTPKAEVELCGHATIASFCALLDAGIVSAGGFYHNDTLAGQLQIRIENNFIMMDMAPPAALNVIDKRSELKEIYKVMGLSDIEKGITLDGEWELYPEIISTGLPDILLPVANRDVLKTIQPDFPALSLLSKKYGVIGVHAFALGEGLVGTNCPANGQVTAYCRNFAPAVGIDEEAATGTSNGALTYYLYKNALIDDGANCIFIQGESMGRPSKIVGRLRVEEEEGIKVQIGGTGAVLARGEILL
ncbi:MAG: PhzF family phenazine biosynthesis protein [Eubacteriales bacterium]|nr:PhzF family phenazine biosynthesis protein [Eubacteriales bacterium]